MVPLNNIENKGQRNIHTVLLANLTPNTNYTFQINWNNNEIGSQYNFSTQPDINSLKTITIISGGDVGYTSLARSMIGVARQNNPDLILIGGDFAYDNGVQSCYYAFDQLLWYIENNIFIPMQNLVPMVISIGNHEVGLNSISGYNFEINQESPLFFFFFPQNSVSDQYGNPQVPSLTQRLSYHYHTFGNILLTSLDTGYVTPYSGEQYQWLVNVSNSYSNYVKMSIYHVPIYSPEYSVGEELQSSSDLEAQEQGLGYFIPVFDQFNYSAVFENHCHIFKRTFPLKYNLENPNGTVYFGEGMWGVSNNMNIDKLNNATGIFEVYEIVNNIWKLVIYPDVSQYTNIWYIPLDYQNQNLTGIYNQFINNNVI